MPVRIYDIAKKLGIESKEVLARARALGITAAKVPSSSLDKITAEYLENELGGVPASTSPSPAIPVAPPEPVLIVAPPPAPEVHAVVEQPPIVPVAPPVIEPVVEPVPSELEPSTIVEEPQPVALPTEAPQTE